jgi:hypothetical protein
VPKVASRVAGLAAAGLLGVGALLIPGTGSGAAPAPGRGSAFGVSATGAVAIAATPTAPPDNTLAKINVPTLLTAGVLKASSTPNATGVTSSASVADVNALVGSVKATLIASTCTANGATLTGSSTLADLTLTGLSVPTVPGVTIPTVPGVTVPAVTLPPTTVPVNPGPNTKFTIPGVATVVLNEQLTSADKQTLTVNAVHITSLVPGVTQEVTIADSVCTLAAAATSTTTTSSTPATTPTTTRGSSGGGTAPGATPVQGRPAFTG